MSHKFRFLLIVMLFLLIPLACGEEDADDDGDSSNSPSESENVPATAPEIERVAAWQVSDIQVIDDIEGLDRLEVAALSPDGERLAAYLGRQAVRDEEGEYILDEDGRPLRTEPRFCIYTFADESLACTEAPVEEAGYPHPRLIWSPDGSKIAYTEDWQVVLDDSDIWLFDVESATFSNRTDDGVMVNIQRGDVDENILLDYLPRWHPTNGDLYFFRTPYNEDPLPLRLYRLPADGGEPVLVRDLSDELPYLPLRTASVFALDDRVSISPDGTRMALGIRAMNQEESEQDGVYVLDLDGDSPPRHIMTRDDFYAGMPDWQREDEDLQPAGLAWSADGRYLVALGHWPMGVGGILGAVQVVDVASGEVMPVADFSGYESKEAFFGYEGELEESPRLWVPAGAALTPDGMSVMLWGSAQRQSNLGVAALPPAGATPTLIYLEQPDDEPTMTYDRLWGTETGANGRVRIGANLIMLEPAE